MNKLTISQREEIDNYNLIIENINKLVDMCGNTKEAIELRDNLFNLFTTKYSEPLYDVLGLQEQIGCPLDVVLKALKYGIYQEDGGRRKLPFIEYNSGTNKFYFGFGTYCNVEDYKKTWWLKKDKSE